MRFGGFLLCVALAWTGVVSPARAGIDEVSGLRCSGSGGSFTILFDHDRQLAQISNAAGTFQVSYEQGTAFLTWRFVDANGRERYVIRQGDRVNGDFGWYFTGSVSDPDGIVHATVDGNCSPAD